MKKIIAIFCCVLLVVGMVLPFGVYAAEGDVVVKCVWLLSIDHHEGKTDYFVMKNDIVADTGNYLNVYVDFTYEGKQYSYISICDLLNEGSFGPIVKFAYEDGVNGSGSPIYKFDTVFNGQSMEHGVYNIVLDFGEGSVVTASNSQGTPEDFVQFLNDNATPGSTENDNNGSYGPEAPEDNVLDSLPMGDFPGYPETLVQLVHNSEAYLYVCQLGGSKYLYMLSKPLHLMSDGYLHYSDDTVYSVYLQFNGYWDFDNPNSQGLTANKGDQFGQPKVILASSQDIPIVDDYGFQTGLYMRGDTNFPPPLPLHQVVQGMTENSLVTMKTAMGGTMEILMVCGVGLMACLAVLNLFGKRSLISRR